MKRKKRYIDVIVLGFILYGIIGGEIIQGSFAKGMDILPLADMKKYAFYVSGNLPFQIQNKIRVLISDTDYQSKYHSSVCLGSEDGMIIEKNGETIRCLANEQVTFQAEEAVEGNIIISSLKENGQITVYSVSRGGGNPSYFGNLELKFTQDGIVMVNEVDLEKYLYLVVPSEMPVSYEKEALKAQAVCARTYAVAKIKQGLDPVFFSHLDDSVSSQVYANQSLKEESVKAVDETYGMVLMNGNEVGSAYYFSTSCGLLSHPEDIWIKEKEEELKTVSATTLNESQQIENQLKSVLEQTEGLEQAYPYFRWKVKIPYDSLEEKTGVGNISNISVLKRGESGVAKILSITGDAGEKQYIGEYEIRSILSPMGLDLMKQNNEINSSMNLLPSGYFYGIMEEDGYMIYGGGYGHGAGMSQNGANELAKQGYTYEEILKYYFENEKVLKIYR